MQAGKKGGKQLSRSFFLFASQPEIVSSGETAMKPRCATPRRPQTCSSSSTHCIAADEAFSVCLAYPPARRVARALLGTWKAVSRIARANALAVCHEQSYRYFLLVPGPALACSPIPLPPPLRVCHLVPFLHWYCFRNMPQCPSTVCDD